jgi:site-specific DNA recombinase
MVAKRLFGDSLFDLEGVPPILDEETWERVCEALKGRANNGGPSVQHLLSKVILCGGCQEPLIANRTSASRGSKAVYACRKRSSAPNACGSLSIHAAPVDELVTEEVCKLLADRQRVESILAHNAAGPEMEERHQRLRELNESLLALDQALKPPPGKPRMPIERYWKAVEEVEDERARLTRGLAVNREASKLAETLDFGEEARERWDERSLEWQRVILGLVVEHLEVEPRGKGASTPNSIFGNVFDPERVKITFADE